MTTTEQIRELAKHLQLPILAEYQDHLDEVVDKPFAEALLYLLQLEVTGKQERRCLRRMKDARFPMIKTLDMFDRSRLPKLNPRQIEELANCDYIRQRYNVLAIGNTGTGKSHLSMALGRKAVESGFTVRYHTVVTLVDQLITAQHRHELQQQIKPLQTCDLLILDEFGYQTLSQEQANLLFQLFVSRHEQRSTYVTTNLEFSKWVAVLGDPTLTAAFVDRFAHKSILLNMNGPSYRLSDGHKTSTSPSPET